MGDSSQNRHEEEEGMGHRMVQKKEQRFLVDHLVCYLPLPMAWNTFLTPL